METLVIQPAFSGNATEFGMVLPLPNRPEINEAPEDIFDVLKIHEDRFRPVIVFAPADSSGSGKKVTVIEQKTVGDFDTTLLTAESADDLVKWLNGRGFEYAGEDLANFEYFVEKGGYYFVAMKVNMNKADLNAQGEINGKLRPIEFVFESEYPMLPLRIMAGDMRSMNIALYTLGTFPYYVPGVDVVFMDRLDNDISDRDSLGPVLWERYDPLDKWLVRMNILFEPREIEKNLLLERLPVVNGAIRPIGDMTRLSNRDAFIVMPVIINRDLLPPGSGVFPEYANIGETAATFNQVMSYRDQTVHGIPSESIECRLGMHLILKLGGAGTACVVLATEIRSLWPPAVSRPPKLKGFDRSSHSKYT